MNACNWPNFIEMFFPTSIGERKLIWDDSLYLTRYPCNIPFRIAGCCHDTFIVVLEFTTAITFNGDVAAVRDK